ncbi:MAG: hypothetical protein ACRDP6_07440 [Actinoallomurus sp.]
MDPASWFAEQIGACEPDLLTKMVKTMAEALMSAEAEAGRVAANAALDNPYAVGRLLDSLREAGAGDQVTALADRLPAAGQFDRFIKMDGHWERFRFGREQPDGSAAFRWTWEDLK